MSELQERARRFIRRVAMNERVQDFVLLLAIGFLLYMLVVGYAPK